MMGMSDTWNRIVENNNIRENLQIKFTITDVTCKENWDDKILSELKCKNANINKALVQRFHSLLSTNNLFWNY